MILADIGQYQALKGYVIGAIQDMVFKKIKDNEHNLKDFFKTYSDEDIKEAITTGIRRAGNKVFMQTSGNIGKILRSLEYGTNTTKALHIVSLATRAVIGGRVL